MTDRDFPTLETDRLILRPWTAEDADDFARMNIDPIVMEFLPRVLNRKDSDKLLKRFMAHFDAHGYGLFAMERKEDGEFVGFTGLQHVEFDAHFAPAIEIAWRLDTEYWGQGYATEAARAVLGYAFGALKLKDIVAFTVHDNERMTHVFDKLGLVHDEGGDFDYPTLPEGHPLGKFILYRMSKKAFKNQTDL